MHEATVEQFRVFSIGEGRGSSHGMQTNSEKSLAIEQVFVHDSIVPSGGWKQGGPFNDSVYNWSTFQVESKI